jgi:hypothetical protein
MEPSRFGTSVRSSATSAPSAVASSPRFARRYGANRGDTPHNLSTPQRDLSSALTSPSASGHSRGSSGYLSPSLHLLAVQSEARHDGRTPGASLPVSSHVYSTTTTLYTGGTGGTAGPEPMSPAFSSPTRATSAFSRQRDTIQEVSSLHPSSLGYIAACCTGTSCSK